jgi:hypothetical protein
MSRCRQPAELDRFCCPTDDDDDGIAVLVNSITQAN